jgi:opacity protein-like surface antigen
MKTFTIAIIVSTAALSAQAATAAAPDAKLWSGTWHLDAAASKWTAAGKETSETRSYDLSAGKLTMNSTAKDAAGKETHLAYTAGCDGKVSPLTGSPRADSISLQCVSGSTIKATSRFHGKVTVQSTATVSSDGKHLTLKRTYVAMKGAPTEVLKFTR